ncbi:hypothetical protein [Aliivibrio fischeri]|uniref:hypothetical protein n=1 Tax=Aliivibrio fischeri TaxID=668 RepID=UPI0012DAB9B3|nr:hypothetical protein [Aliivibrio fischeri]MUJ38307.1 hypothetical protein [Aliivibrio fischeri]
MDFSVSEIELLISSSIKECGVHVMNNKSLKKLNKVEMVINFLEKDLYVINKIDSNQLSLSDIESVLYQSLFRIEKLRKYKVTT